MAKDDKPLDRAELEALATSIKTNLATLGTSMKAMQQAIVELQAGADVHGQPTRELATVGGPLALCEALRLLALDQLASTPLAPTSNGWRRLHDACAEIVGESALDVARPVIGRQASTMQPGYKNPPPKGGAIAAGNLRPASGGSGGAVLAQPIANTGAQPIPKSGTVAQGDIRNRPDVAAEIARTRGGGTPRTG